MNFGNKTAFFAVYDGHGGSEVAEYCSMKLPQFLQELESFKSGNFEQALREAFIGFDATLLEEKVIEELRILARKNPDYDESENEDDDETAEEINNLHQEATMPLNEVLQKYKGNPDLSFAKIQEFAVKTMLKQAKQKDEAEASSSIASGAGGSGSNSSSKPSGSGSSLKKSAADNEVSSSSSKPVNENEADTAVASSSSAAIPAQAPDSTHTIPKPDEGSSKAQQSTIAVPSEGKAATVTASENGVVSDYKISQKSSDDEAISSSSAQENGESASSCPSSSSNTQPASVTAGGGSCSSSSSSDKVPKVPNQISSSSLPETDSDSTSDDENDETYKESPGAKPLNSDDDTTDEDLDQEELDEEEEMSEDEEEEDESFDDDFMSNMETGPGKASGCTAVVALLNGSELYVANAGDSRCVVCRDGKVVEMSFDHKPEDDIELARIRKAGGRVTLDGRVNGGLNLSRAIGDHGYKTNVELSAEEQMISALPDLKRLTLEPSDEFMVLACDGIWNYMSNEEVVGFVKQRIDAGRLTLAEICEEVSLILPLLVTFLIIFLYSCSTTAWHQTQLEMAPVATT